MSKPVANPTRLSCLPEADDALGVGRLFRNARELPDEALPTLRWRLRTSLRLRTMRPRLVLRVAVVVAVVFCLGGVVGAVVSPLWPRQQPATADDPGHAAAPAPRARKARPTASAPVPTVPQPQPTADEPAPIVPAPQPTAEPPAPVVPAATPIAAEATAPAAPTSPVVGKPTTSRTTAAHREPARLAAASPPVPLRTPAAGVAPLAEAPSAIATEQALVGQAMRTLRDGHDAATALALLGQHAQRFPAGALASEATVLRIEALLVLGRQDEALSLLDRMPLGSLPNRDEQLVVRGELRAAHGRWREANQDFDQALRLHGLPAATARARNLQQRALWGRAAAHSRLGAQAAARADLELYLRHFPTGPFAGPATSLLKAVP